jgi:hypothetical protein
LHTKFESKNLKGVDPETKLQFPHGQYHTKKHFLKKKLLQTSLSHISLLTIQVKNTVTYMKQFGLMHQLIKTFSHTVIVEETCTIYKCQL